MTFTTSGSGGEALWLARAARIDLRSHWARNTRPPSPCQLIEELSGHVQGKNRPARNPA